MVVFQDDGSLLSFSFPGKDVTVEQRDDRALLALQGPAVAGLLGASSKALEGGLRLEVR